MFSPEVALKRLRGRDVLLVGVPVSGRRSTWHCRPSSVSVGLSLRFLSCTWTALICILGQTFPPSSRSRSVVHWVRYFGKMVKELVRRPPYCRALASGWVLRNTSHFFSMMMIFDGQRRRFKYRVTGRHLLYLNSVASVETFNPINHDDPLHFVTLRDGHSLVRRRSSTWTLTVSGPFIRNESQIFLVLRMHVRHLRNFVVDRFFGLCVMSL